MFMCVFVCCASLIPFAADFPSWRFFFLCDSSVCPAWSPECQDPMGWLGIKRRTLNETVRSQCTKRHTFPPIHTLTARIRQFMDTTHTMFDWSCRVSCVRELAAHLLSYRKALKSHGSSGGHTWVLSEDELMGVLSLQPEDTELHQILDNSLLWADIST